MSARKYTPFIVLSIVVFGIALMFVSGDSAADLLVRPETNVLCNEDIDCKNLEADMKAYGSLSSCNVLKCDTGSHQCMKVRGEDEFCCGSDVDCNPYTTNVCAPTQACQESRCVVVDEKIGKECDDKDLNTIYDACNGGVCVGVPQDADQNNRPAPLLNGGVNSGEVPFPSREPQCRQSSDCNGMQVEGMDDQCSFAICERGECARRPSMSMMTQAPPCDDGNAETLQDRCNPEGSCSPGKKCPEGSTSYGGSDICTCNNGALDGPFAGDSMEEKCKVCRTGEEMKDGQCRAATCENGDKNPPQCDDCAGRGGDTDGDKLCDPEDPCPKDPEQFTKMVGQGVHYDSNGKAYAEGEMMPVRRPSGYYGEPLCPSDMVTSPGSEPEVFEPEAETEAEQISPPSPPPVDITALPVPPNVKDRVLPEADDAATRLPQEPAAKEMVPAPVPPPVKEGTPLPVAAETGAPEVLRPAAPLEPVSAEEIGASAPKDSTSDDDGMGTKGVELEVAVDAVPLTDAPLAPKPIPTTEASERESAERTDAVPEQDDTLIVVAQPAVAVPLIPFTEERAVAGCGANPCKGDQVCVPMAPQRFECVLTEDLNQFAPDEHYGEFIVENAAPNVGQRSDILNAHAEELLLGENADCRFKNTQNAGLLPEQFGPPAYVVLECPAEEEEMTSHGSLFNWIGSVFGW